MNVQTHGGFTVAAPSDGTLRVRIGDYLVIITPDRRTEPRVETTYVPQSKGT